MTTAPHEVLVDADSVYPSLAAYATQPAFANTVQWQSYRENPHLIRSFILQPRFVCQLLPYVQVQDTGQYDSDIPPQYYVPDVADRELPARYAHVDQLKYGQPPETIIGEEPRQSQQSDASSTQSDPLSDVWARVPHNPIQLYSPYVLPYAYQNNERYDGTIYILDDTQHLEVTPWFDVRFSKLLFQPMPLLTINQKLYNTTYIYNDALADALALQQYVRDTYFASGAVSLPPAPTTVATYAVTSPNTNAGIFLHNATHGINGQVFNAFSWDEAQQLAAQLVRDSTMRTTAATPAEIQAQYGPLARVSTLNFSDQQASRWRRTWLNLWWRTRTQMPLRTYHVRHAANAPLKRVRKATIFAVCATLAEQYVNYSVDSSVNGDVTAMDVGSVDMFPGLLDYGYARAYNTPNACVSVRRVEIGKVIVQLTADIDIEAWLRTANVSRYISLMPTELTRYFSVQFIALDTPIVVDDSLEQEHDVTYDDWTPRQISYPLYMFNQARYTQLYNLILAELQPRVRAGDTVETLIERAVQRLFARTHTARATNNAVARQSASTQTNLPLWLLQQRRGTAFVDYLDQAARSVVARLNTATRTTYNSTMRPDLTIGSADAVVFKALIDNLPTGSVFGDDLYDLVQNIPWYTQILRWYANDIKVPWYALSLLPPFITTLVLSNSNAFKFEALNRAVVPRRNALGAAVEAPNAYNNLATYRNAVQLDSGELVDRVYIAIPHYLSAFLTNLELRTPIVTRGGTREANYVIWQSMEKDLEWHIRRAHFVTPNELARNVARDGDVVFDRPFNVEYELHAYEFEHYRRNYDFYPPLQTMLYRMPFLHTLRLTNWLPVFEEELLSESATNWHQLAHFMIRSVRNLAFDPAIDAPETQNYELERISLEYLLERQTATINSRSFYWSPSLRVLELQFDSVLPHIQLNLAFNEETPRTNYELDAIIELKVALDDEWRLELMPELDSDYNIAQLEIQNTVIPDLENADIQPVVPVADIPLVPEVPSTLIDALRNPEGHDNFPPTTVESNALWPGLRTDTWNQLSELRVSDYCVDLFTFPLPTQLRVFAGRWLWPETRRPWFYTLQGIAWPLTLRELRLAPKMANGVTNLTRKGFWTFGGDRTDRLGSLRQLPRALEVLHLPHYFVVDLQQMEELPSALRELRGVVMVSSTTEGPRSAQTALEDKDRILADVTLPDNLCEFNYVNMCNFNQTRRVWKNMDTVSPVSAELRATLEQDFSLAPEQIPADAPLYDQALEAWFAPAAIEDAIRAGQSDKQREDALVDARLPNMHWTD